MNNTTDIETLLADPCWRFTSIKPEGGLALFTYNTRSEIDKNNFADHQFLSGVKLKQIELPIQKLMSIESFQLTQPVHFIWHTAFCGSTLIARTLALDEHSLSIREPNVLMQLAMFKRNNLDFVTSNPFWEKILSLSIRLLARGFSQSEPVIIKPSNSMNNLAIDIMNLQSTSKHLLIYSEVKDFLISNLKKGPEYIQFIDSLLQLFSMDSDEDLQLMSQAASLDPLSKTALVWDIQMRNFCQMLTIQNPSQIGTLYFKDFLAKPKTTLIELYNFFNMNIYDDVVTDDALNKVLSIHSKNSGVSYSSSRKEQEDADIIKKNGTTIEMALENQKHYGLNIHLEIIKKHHIVNSLSPTTPSQNTGAL